MPERPRLNPERKEFIPPEPSEDLAWMLGVLCASGHVSKYEVVLDSRRPDLAYEFSGLGKEIFGIDFKPAKGRGKNSKKVRFSSKNMADYFGDLKRSNWHVTFESKHGWLSENDNFLWSFLGGFFDSRGAAYIDKKSGVHRLELHHSSEEGIVTLNNILVNLGPGISLLTKGFRRGTEELLGGRINKISDIRIFATNVRCRLQANRSLMENLRRVDYRYIEARRPMPSARLAWLLGVVFSSGHVGKGKYSKDTRFYELAEELSGTISQIFGVPVTLGIAQKRTADDKRSPYNVVVSTRWIPDYFAELHRDWLEGYAHNTNWIISNNVYTSSFLSGYFDGAGVIKDPRLKGGFWVELDTTDVQKANALILLLGRLGLEHIFVHKDKRRAGGIAGVRVSSLREVCKFSEIVVSTIPEREEILAFYREIYKEQMLMEEAHEIVMRLRRQYKWGPDKILSHIKLSGFKGLSADLIRGWIYRESKPNRKKRSYSDWIDKESKN